MRIEIKGTHVTITAREKLLLDDPDYVVIPETLWNRLGLFVADHQKKTGDTSPVNVRYHGECRNSIIDASVIPSGVVMNVYDDTSFTDLKAPRAQCTPAATLKSAFRLDLYDDPSEGDELKSVSTLSVASAESEVPSSPVSTASVGSMSRNSGSRSASVVRREHIRPEDASHFVCKPTDKVTWPYGIPSDKPIVVTSDAPRWNMASRFLVLAAASTLLLTAAFGAPVVAIVAATAALALASLWCAHKARVTQSHANTEFCDTNPDYKTQVGVPASALVLARRYEEEQAAFDLGLATCGVD